MNRFFDFIEQVIAMLILLIVSPFGWIGMVLLGGLIWIIKK